MTEMFLQGLGENGNKAELFLHSPQGFCIVIIQYPFMYLAVLPYFPETQA